MSIRRLAALVGLTALLVLSLVALFPPMSAAASSPGPITEASQCAPSSWGDSSSCVTPPPSPRT